MQHRVRAEIAGRISRLHGRVLLAQDRAQVLDAVAGHALRAKAGGAGLEENADFMNRDQVCGIDSCDDHATTWLLHREALRDQPEHRLAHRTARDV